MSIILMVCDGRCQGAVYGCERNNFTNGGKNQYLCGLCWLIEPALKNCPWSTYGGNERALLPWPEDGQNDQRNGIKIERTLCSYCKKFPKVASGRFNIKNLKPT